MFLNRIIVSFVNIFVNEYSDISNNPLLYGMKLRIISNNYIVLELRRLASGSEIKSWNFRIWNGW